METAERAKPESFPLTPINQGMHHVAPPMPVWHRVWEYKKTANKRVFSVRATQISKRLVEVTIRDEKDGKISKGIGGFLREKDFHPDVAAAAAFENAVAAMSVME